MPEQTAEQDRYWARVAELTQDECVAYTTEEYAAFVEGRLRPGDARAIEAHLATCDECRWLVEQLRQEVAEVTATAPAVRVRPSAPLVGRFAWASAAVVAVVALALCAHLLRGGVSPVQPQGAPSGAIIARGSDAPGTPSPVTPETGGVVEPPAPSAAANSVAPPASGVEPRPSVPARGPAARRSSPTSRPARAPRQMMAKRPQPPRPAASDVRPPDVLEGPADSYGPAPAPMSVPRPAPGVLALNGGDSKPTYAAPESPRAPQVVNPMDRSSSDAARAQSIKERMFAPLLGQAPVSRDDNHD